MGLLLGNLDAKQNVKPKVLVTNDLTYQVAVDAIKQGASVIVSYRMMMMALSRSSTDKPYQPLTRLF